MTSAEATASVMFTPSPTPAGDLSPGLDKGILSYLELRELRIKHNEQVLAEMGLMEMSRQLANDISASAQKKRAIRTSKSDSASAAAAGKPPVATRRSSRLQGGTPTSYRELSMKEMIALEGGCRGQRWGTEADDAGRGGPQPEEYTEKHDKLLGSYEEEWELFVDGCNAFGEKIYDSVKGKTCHQCRQKTLGHRTSCSTCKSLLGQFCGDCLFMRYGENVLEANAKSDWTCPPCRGICNCSFCRSKNGWCPTGSLYRKIKALGFKSVAHYLIKTRRAESEGKNEAAPADDTSSKETEVLAQQSQPNQNADTASKIVPAAAVAVNVEARSARARASQSLAVATANKSLDFPVVKTIVSKGSGRFKRQRVIY